MIRGSQKGGVGVGGPTFGKNSQIISLFLFESVPNLAPFSAYYDIVGKSGTLPS